MTTRTKNSADLLAGITALGWRSAAYLSRLMGVSGANMSAFVGWRQPKAVNDSAVAEALKLSGFVCADGVVDFTTECGGCPMITAHQLSANDEVAVRQMFHVLKQQGFHLSVNEFCNEAMALAGPDAMAEPRGYLVTLHKPDPLAGFWAAVAIEPAGAKSQTLTILKELQGERGFGSGVIRVSRRLYKCWRSSGPRFDEVLDAIEMSEMWPEITQMSKSLAASAEVENAALVNETDESCTPKQVRKPRGLAL